jgi:uncharacterized protein GlcG (DUF336 family)
MDGAPHMAIEASRAKANSALMGMSTQQLAKKMARNAAGIASITALNDHILLGGGLPIIYDGEVIGGLGVGGAATADDIAVAEAALASLAKG